jgi:hypothetical protein
LTQVKAARAGAFQVNQHPSEQRDESMALLYEQEIKNDLVGKNETLAAQARRLDGWTASDPVPIAELMAALEEARAAVRDCAVLLENHFGGLIPLAPETLGEAMIVLRAADVVVAGVVAALTPRRG